MLKQGKISLLLALFIVFLLAGCGQVRDFRRGNIFEARFEAYSAAIRWGEFEKAATFIKMREGKPRKPDLDYLKTIRVTRYELIEEKTPHKDEELGIIEAYMANNVEYYFVNSGRVKNFRYEQLWWYDVEADNWFMDGDLPDFKAEQR